MSHKPSGRKFEEFLKLCAHAKAQQLDTVLISSPQSLGDTYQEMILCLDRLAQADLALRIAPPAQRTLDQSGAFDKVARARDRI